MFASHMMELGLSRSKARPAFQPALEALEERLVLSPRAGLPANVAVDRMNHSVTMRISNLIPGHNYQVKVDFHDGTRDARTGKSQVTIGSSTPDQFRNITFSTNHTYSWKQPVRGQANPNAHEYHWYIYDQSAGGRLVKHGIGMIVQVWTPQQAQNYLAGR